MGSKASSEKNGVTCAICNLKLPPNNYYFIKCAGYYCFFEYSDGGYSTSYTMAKQSSVTVTINKGVPLFKYFREVGVNSYKCAVCFSKTQSKQSCRALDIQIQGKGVIAIPSDSIGIKSKQENVTTLISRAHKKRLRGFPDGNVDTTDNNDAWEQWEWQWIDTNRFFWKNKAHGTYLRANPDGKVDLSSNQQEWEIWTKADFGVYHTWRSCHGTYLRSYANGVVDLAPHAQTYEQWID